MSKRRETMFRKIDRILLRVPSLPPAVRFYTQTMGLRLIKQDKRLASLAFIDDPDVELILHTDEDLPAEATYYRVDDVRDLYTRRADLKLTFVSPPTRLSLMFTDIAPAAFLASNTSVALVIDSSSTKGSRQLRCAMMLSCGVRQGCSM